MFFRPSCVPLASCLLLALVAVGYGQAAADYPTRPITLIVPFAAGGGTDTLARIAGQAMEQTLGKPLVVVNKTGAGGVMGFTDVAHATPNGYTVGCVPYPEVFMAPESRKTPYAPDDFVYLAIFNAAPTCLILRKEAPYANLNELLAYAKAHPGKATVSLAGDTHMLSVVLLETAAGVTFTPVRYKSGSEAFNAVMGGHVDMAMIAPSFGGIALQQNMPVVGVTSETRFQALKNVPTFKEQGYDVVMSMAQVFIAPKNTPEPVLARLREACDKAAADPELARKTEQAGYDFVYLRGDALNQYLERMNALYLPIMRAKLDRFAK